MCLLVSKHIFLTCAKLWWVYFIWIGGEQTNFPIQNHWLQYSKLTNILHVDNNKLWQIFNSLGFEINRLLSWSFFADWAVIYTRALFAIHTDWCMCWLVHKILIDFDLTCDCIQSHAAVYIIDIVRINDTNARNENKCQRNSLMHERANIHFNKFTMSAFPRESKFFIF